MKAYSNGGWAVIPETGDIMWFPPGEYEPGESRKPEIVIPRMAIHSLLNYLEENGYIKPRLDERLRAEDLKITHRLLDTVQALIGKV